MGTLSLGEQGELYFTIREGVNMVDFQSSWNEQVRARIEKAFTGLLKLEKPYPRCIIFSKVALCLLLAV